MGGMFTVFKVREGLARTDYSDPGWYKHPPGTVAYEWKGATPQAERAPDVATPSTPVVSVRKPADILVALVRQATFLHASGISQAISTCACDAVFHAIGIARAAGVRISYDCNLRTRLWPLDRARAIIDLTIGMTDYFFPSLDEARALWGLDAPEAIVDRAHRLGAKVVELKLGADGALLSDGVRQDRIEGVKVDVVDATGAGDCFVGAFLARLTKGDTLWEAGAYANIAAALSTTGYGAIAPIPRPEAIWVRMDSMRRSS